MRVTVDKFGRIVLPKSVREVLELNAGATLELEQDGEDIRLHPVRSTEAVFLKDGLPLYIGDVPDDITDWLARDRAARNKQISRGRKRRRS